MERGAWSAWFDWLDWSSGEVEVSTAGMKALPASIARNAPALVPPVTWAIIVAPKRTGSALPPSVGVSAWSSVRAVTASYRPRHAATKTGGPIGPWNSAIDLGEHGPTARPTAAVTPWCTMGVVDLTKTQAPARTLSNG